jgi:hypothetical protein
MPYELRPPPLNLTGMCITGRLIVISLGVTAIMLNIVLIIHFSNPGEVH